MITFKQYLQEEGEDKIHKNIKQAAEAFVANCTQWKDVSVPLWRWSDAPSGQIGHPMRSRVPRQRAEKSRGGSASIQEYLAELPSWKNIPSRQNSIFCSTTKDFLVSGGSRNPENTLAIFPYDNAKIAVLTNDIDFNEMDITRGMSGAFDRLDPNALTYWVETLVDRVSTGGPTSFKDMVSYLQKTFLNNGKFDPDANGDETAANGYASVSDKMKSKIQSFVKAVPDCFAPENLGLEVVSPGQVPLDEGTLEVWFSDKYLSIPVPMYKEFVEEVKKLQGNS